MKTLERISQYPFPDQIIDQPYPGDIKMHSEIGQPILTPGNASLAVILLLFNSFISLAYMGTFN